MFKLFIFIILILFTQIGLTFSNSYIIMIDNNNQSIIKENKLQSTKVFNIPISRQKINNFLLNNKEQEYYYNKLLKYHTFKSDNTDIIKQFDNIEINRKFHINNLPNADVFANKEWNMKQIKISSAWQKATGKGIIISLVDTGIDFEHPDLKNSLWINTKEDLNKNGTFEPWSYLETRNGLTGDLNGKDDDGNGTIDDIIGYDFVDQYQVAFGDYTQPDPIPEDEGEHGTNVAGVMVARPLKDSSIIGAAYDAKLMIAKAFDITGNAEADDIARAIVYSVLNGANVINMSFGDNYPAQIVYDAIKFAYYSGCILVSSSGNNGWNLPHYPSDYPEVISVGGSDEKGKRWSFSNYGPYVDLIAPARSIYTTDVGGRYKTTNGTSVAAPHVSAVAALLLELNKELKQDDIKTILQMSAFQNKDDYDNFYLTGAGVLDASKSVENIYNGKTKFISPDFDEIIDTNQATISIKANISHPLFDKAELLLSQSIDTIKWESIAFIPNQIINGEVATLPIDKLNNGKNLLCIRLYLKNNRYYDEIIPINYYNTNDKFTFLYWNNFAAYYNEKRVRVVGASTSRVAELIVKYKTANSDEEYVVAKEYTRYSKNHYLILNDLKSNTEYTAIIQAISGKDTITQNFNFNTDNGYWNTINFSLKPYTTNRSYIYNNISDLYGNGKAFTVNDLQSLYIGKTFTKQLVDGKIKNIDSSQKGYIAVGYGDSNGDGIQEILTTAEFNTILYQAKSKNGNPFENILFQNMGSSFWAEQFFDIDKDGKEEIIGYSYEALDKSYKIVKYENGKYVYTDTLQYPHAFKNISIERGSALQDFDGDGNYELCFVNTKGNLFIYEYTKEKGFTLEYIDSTDLGNSNQYVTKADIDGDGIYEILHATYGSNVLHGKFGTSDPIWRFRVIKSNATNSYYTLWQEFFVPVRDGATRQGFFYRNGVAAGNLDNEAGDEIVLLPFPNLYVLKWNKADHKFENFWYYPSSLSNSALIADLDGNGTNELGFTGFNAMRFFEHRSGTSPLMPPSNIDAWSNKQTDATFIWDKVPNAEKYKLYRLVVQNEELIPIEVKEFDSSNINEKVFEPLAPDSTYYFLVTSINSKFQNPESDFSALITVNTNKRIAVKKVEQINNNIMKITFTGKVATNSLEPSIFTLTKQSTATTYIPSSAIVLQDSLIIISFNGTISNGQYLLNIQSFRDYNKNWTIASSDTINWKNAEPPQELYLTKLEFVSETLIKLYFNKEVDSSAINRNNYIFKPFGEALFVELDPLNTTAVMMNISQLFRNNGARGLNYTITARNIVSKDGTLITLGSGNTLGFVISAPVLQDVYIYPNPIKRSELSQIFFANLTQNATITIKTIDGAEIIKLYENDGNGGLEWDGRDRNGNLLPTGIYVYTIEGKNSYGDSVMSDMKKFVVIP